MASALLLQSRIQSEFQDIRIEDVIAYHNLLKRRDFSGIDLIISTIPLHLHGLPPVMVVNVILKESDMENLRKALLVQKPSAGALPQVAVAEGPRLEALIDNSLIMLRAEADDWQAACMLAGGLLLRANLVSPEYVEAIQSVVREFSPYVVAWPGVALLHAPASGGARQPGMSLVTLQTPVRFGHPENDPVDVLIALSIPQGHSFALALGQINHLLTDAEALARLRAAYTRSMAMMLIRKFSRVVEA
jgi:PTS system ascorbate-specific IIA component